MKTGVSLPITRNVRRWWNWSEKDETFMAVGRLFLTLSVILEVFFEMSYMGFSITDFLKGVLVGISLTTNLAYLVRRKLAQRNDANGSIMMME